MSIRAVALFPIIQALRSRRKRRVPICTNRVYYRAPLSDRFWSKVDRRSINECWPWLASTRNGYGQFGLNKRSLGAHRIAYLLAYGTIPAGLEIDHLCENKLCQNPSHLEAVTPRENKIRSKELARL